MDFEDFHSQEGPGRVPSFEWKSICRKGLCSKSISLSVGINKKSVS